MGMAELLHFLCFFGVFWGFIKDSVCVTLNNEIQNGEKPKNGAVEMKTKIVTIGKMDAPEDIRGRQHNSEWRSCSISHRDRVWTWR